MKQRGFTLPGEAGRGRRGAGVLGERCRKCFQRPERQRCWMHKTCGEPPELPPEVWPGEGQAGTASRSGWPKRRLRRPSGPSTTGSSATPRQVPQAPPPAWLATATNCSRSTTSPLPTGRTFERPTSSSRPSQRSDTAAREPRAASHARPCCPMIYKMGRCAEKSWRCGSCGFRQLAKVIQGVRFNDGIELIVDGSA